MLYSQRLKEEAKQVKRQLLLYQDEKVASLRRLEAILTISLPHLQAYSRFLKGIKEHKLKKEKNLPVHTSES